MLLLPVYGQRSGVRSRMTGKATWRQWDVLPLSRLSRLHISTIWVYKKWERGPVHRCVENGIRAVWPFRNGRYTGSLEDTGQVDISTLTTGSNHCVLPVTEQFNVSGIVVTRRHYRKHRKNLYRTFTTKAVQFAPIEAFWRSTVLRCRF